MHVKNIIDKLIIYSAKIIELKTLLADIRKIHTRMSIVKLQSRSSLSLIEKEILEKIEKLQYDFLKGLNYLISKSGELSMSKIKREDSNYTENETCLNITHFSSYDLKNGFLIFNVFGEDGNSLPEHKRILNLHTGKLHQLSRKKLANFEPVIVEDVVKHMRFNQY